jgi:hypothetical protein
VVDAALEHDVVVIATMIEIKDHIVVVDADEVDPTLLELSEDQLLLNADS